MEEIKFRYRIKVIETGEILTQFYTLEEIELGLLTNKNSYKFEILSRDLWTGEIDEEKKEIFEGDIVKGIFKWADHLKKSDVEILSEVYEESSFGYYVDSKDKTESFSLGRVEKIRIIDNKYSNWECGRCEQLKLIKEGKNIDLIPKHFRTCKEK